MIDCILLTLKSYSFQNRLINFYLIEAFWLNVVYNISQKHLSLVNNEIKPLSFRALDQFLVQIAK